MKDIAIYGAGGLGKEVAILVERLKIEENWNFLGFFDDGLPKGTKISNLGFTLGNIDEVNSWPNNLALVLCFGNPKTLLYIKEKIINQNIYFPNLVAPSCWFGNVDTFTLGEGNIIQGSCNFSTDVSIGNFNILNGEVNIGHDTEIGDYNVIMPRVLISGEVKIDSLNLFGASSFVKQQIKIGSNITLTPLSVLLTKPKDGQTYIGNPAKIFKF